VFLLCLYFFMNNDIMIVLDISMLSSNFSLVIISPSIIEQFADKIYINF